MMRELPDGWAYTTLGEVVDYAKTEKIKPSGIKDDAWILELEDIEKGTSKLIRYVKYAERNSKSTKNRFRIGDVLYGKLRPYLDKVIIAGKNGYCSTEIIPIQPSAILNGHFLFYSLKRKEFLDHVTEVSHGLNMPRLGTKQGNQAPFTLAPLNEQIRIANQLDSLLAKVETTQTRLDKIPTLLKRFRQAVLAAATSGALTAEWREVNDFAVDYQDKTIGDLAEVQTGKTPLKSESSFYENGDIPWLTSGVTGQRIVNCSEKFVTRKAVIQCKLKIFPPGTLLVAMYGEGKTRGQVTEINIPATINQACAAVIADEILIHRTYLKLCNEVNYEKTRLMAEGGNQPNLNLSKVKAIPILLPKMEEQREIVHRVESLFALADRVEKHYLQAQSRLKPLLQSILAKAFRGELVQQLLARIQAEREKLKPAKKSRKARKSASK